jgi:hypothetical protein
MSRQAWLLVSLLVGCGGTDTTPAQESSEVAENASKAEVEVAGEVAAAEDGAKTEWDAFGTLSETGEVMSAAALLDDPAPHVGKTLAVEGRVADVCQKAGCWMVVTDGDRNMRVRMKDHGFAVAKDGTGRDCRVHGEVVEIEVDPATVAHFKSESAKPEEMPEAALPEDAKVTYELIASAVQLKR